MSDAGDRYEADFYYTFAVAAKIWAEIVNLVAPLQPREQRCPAVGPRHATPAPGVALNVSC